MVKRQGIGQSAAKTNSLFLRSALLTNIYIFERRNKYDIRRKKEKQFEVYKNRLSEINVKESSDYKIILSMKLQMTM